MAEEGVNLLPAREYALLLLREVHGYCVVVCLGRRGGVDVFLELTLLVARRGNFAAIDSGPLLDSSLITIFSHFSTTHHCSIILAIVLPTEDQALSNLISICFDAWLNVIIYSYLGCFGADADAATRSLREPVLRAMAISLTCSLIVLATLSELLTSWVIFGPKTWKSHFVSHFRLRWLCYPFRCFLLACAFKMRMQFVHAHLITPRFSAGTFFEASPDA